MGRNEIRLRRQRMTSGQIARHRNYQNLLERHSYDQKIRRLGRIMTYLLVAAILIILFVIIVRIEKKANTKSSVNFVPAVVKSSGDFSTLPG